MSPASATVLREPHAGQTGSPTAIAPSAAAAPVDIERWNAWDAFLETREDSTFMQTSWWADFRRGNRWRHSAIVLRHAGAVLGGAVVLKRSHTSGECFYYIADGPVLSGNENTDRQLMTAIMRDLDKRRATEEERVTHLRIEPRWREMPSFAEGFRGVKPFMQPRTTLCIDLRPPMETILARMKPKGRYNTGLARRHGVTIVEDVSERGMEDFRTIYRGTMQRHGLKGVTDNYLGRLMPLVVSPGHASIFFAEYQGQRLATALVVYFGKWVTYLFGGSVVEHRNVMAPYLLHFEIMRRARERGHEGYDLFGGVPESETKHPWHEISVFKRKLGGYDVSFVPTLDYVYDEPAYERFVAQEDGQPPPPAESAADSVLAESAGPR